MKKKIIDTPKGKVIILGPVATDEIRQLDMDEGLSAFRQPLKQKSALLAISDLPESQVYLAIHESTIIGYLTFHFPDINRRWSAAGDVILELGGIEVSKNWRKMNIFTELLTLAFANAEMENHIVISIGCCNYWDFEQSGLNPWEYREMLLKVGEKFGLAAYETDDEEVRNHPTNVLMARFGKHVSWEDRYMFETLRFQDKWLF